MIRHLTPADYTTMPWANGKGVTVEMLRVEQDGGLLWRLSRASVVEDGDFSLFPGVDRNLTVITGPGFDLVGQGLHLQAKPLVPVAFPGDVTLRATKVTAASDDFNVMTARHLPRPSVQVIHGRADLPGGDTLAIFVLNDATANGITLARHDLILTDQPTSIVGQAIAVRLYR